MTHCTQQDLDKARAAEVERRKKRASLEKKLREIEQRLGVGQLFGPGSVITQAAKSREEKVVLDALALGIDVHKSVLGFHRLLPEANPRVPPSDPNEAPF